MSAHTISGQDARTPHAETPCPGCGARRFDRGRFFEVYGLCAYCFADEEQREQAGDRWRLTRPELARRLDSKPAEALPGTEGKILAMLRRVSLGLAIHHPDDARPWQASRASSQTLRPPTPATLRKKAIPPPADDPNGEDICPGVDVDRSRKTVAYRARPCFRGVRVTLGQFATHKEAADAIYALWASLKQNQPGRAKVWQRRQGEPEAAAIVQCWDGWHEVEIPPKCPRAIGKKAGRRIMARTWATIEAAEQAFRQELAKIKAALKR